jgi:hypothetical protein
MAIDHGLGGKDNAKARDKRARKAERQKQRAHKSIVVNHKKKKEVVFDEDARLKFLTGFRQRKTERRKYGLAMQILKDKQEHRDVMKQKRTALREARGGDDVKVVSNVHKKAAEDVEDEREGEEEEEEEEEHAESDFVESNIDSSAVYTDEGTVGMFGGSVAVQVGAGVDEEGEEDGGLSGGEEDAAELKRFIKARVARDQAKELSKFDKAVRKVQQSGILSKKAKQKKSRPRPDGDGGGGGGGRGGGSSSKFGARPGSGSKKVAQYAKVKAAKGLVQKASRKASHSYRLTGKRKM